MKVVITGGLGFIGSAMVRKAQSQGDHIVVVDSCSYAADQSRVPQENNPYALCNIDICQQEDIDAIIKDHKPDCIVNFAAQTHVDRSIKESSAFVASNIMGVHVLLEAARKHSVEKFVQISTDEVYGEIAEGLFREGDCLKPNSPYAASKASADLLIRSYVRTYGFPAIVIRPCNNYGPWQYPEKFIPRAILRILQNKKIPVYGRGENIREWLYVEECAEAIYRLIARGEIGQVYNLGSGFEVKNIDLARMILRVMKKDEEMIEFVKDRPGHDLRYKLDSEKMYTQLQWSPKVSFVDGLERTVAWCLEHREWMLSKAEDIARLYGEC